MAGQIDTPALLVKFLASLNPIKVHNGDEFTLTWVDADEPFTTPAAPFATFSLLRTPPLDVTSRRAETRYDPVNTQDVIAFNAGTYSYSLADDLLDLKSVTGTFGGNGGHAFVEGTDFVITAEAGKDLVLTTIQWLPSGDNPDNGTNFTVDYDYPDIIETVSRRAFIDARLTLYTTTLESGEQGASEYWPKSRLAQALGESFLYRLSDAQGRNLAGTGDLTVGPAAALGVLDLDPGDSLVRYTVDLRLRRNVQEENVYRRTRRVDAYNQTTNI